MIPYGDTVAVRGSSIRTFNLFIISGTDPISLLILLFFLLGQPSSKNANAPSFQIGSGYSK